MSYKVWFESNKQDIRRSQLDPHIIPGASKLFKGAVQEQEHKQDKYRRGISAIDPDYVREVGAAELCIFDPMEDMPNNTRRVYESADFMVSLWKDSDGNETPQFATVAKREDGIPIFFPRNRMKHAERILSDALHNNILTWDQWAKGVEALSQTVDEAEAVKKVKESIYLLLKRKASKGEFTPEELLTAKNLADEFDIKEFADELNVEVMDLRTLDRKLSQPQQQPRLRLQIVAPHANQRNSTGYQAWHQLHNPIRSSFGTKWNQFIKWEEIHLNEFPLKVQQLLKNIHDEVDGKGKRAFEDYNRGWLYEELKKIHFENEGIARKSQHFVWAYLRSIGLQNNQKDFRRKECWKCKTEITMNDKICPYCNTDNSRNFGERFTYTYKNRKLYKVLEPVLTHNTDPTVLSMFEAVQEVARNFRDTEENLLENLQEKAEERKSKKRSKRSKKNKMFARKGA